MKMKRNEYVEAEYIQCDYISFPVELQKTWDIWKAPMNVALQFIAKYGSYSPFIYSDAPFKKLL